MSKEAEQLMTKTHTAQVGEKVYDIFALEKFAEGFPIETVQLDLLKDAVASGNTYWHDANGEMFGPAELLKDWPASEKNPLWTSHIENIKNADLNHPIWLTSDGVVFDGMHRLTRAFVDGAKEINIRRFNQLPDWALFTSENNMHRADE